MANETRTSAWRWALEQARAWTQRARSAAPGRLPLGGSQAQRAVYLGSHLEWADLATLGRTTRLQPSDAGDLLLNPIVAACLGWIGTSWPLATLQVGRVQQGQFEPDPGRHPVLELLEQPTADYGGDWLMWALQTDYWLRGNAYAQIVRAGNKPVEICYLPAARMSPIADDRGYLAGYSYELDGTRHRLEVSDTLHFRFGVDPSRPLLGLSPLASAYREVVADNAAAEYQAGLLRGGGVPPWILSPHVPKDGYGATRMTEEEARVLTQQLREWMEHEPGRGRFLPGAVDLHQLAFEPGAMGLEIIRELPETRICALFQIPPVVLQLRAGLLRSTYNNMTSAIAQAWRGCLVPTQDQFAAELTRKLLPGYPGGEGRVLRYDRSSVGELQPDIQAQRESARADYLAGLITLEEARAEGGRASSAALLAELAAQARARQDSRPGGEDPGAPPAEPASRARRGYVTRADDPGLATLEQALADYRAALLAHETRAVETLLRAYGTVEAAVERRLGPLMERIEAALDEGDTVTPTWLAQERRYQALLTAVQEETRLWAEGAAETVETGQAASVAAAEQAGERLARAALGPEPVGAVVNWNRLPKETLEAFVGLAGDGSPLADLLEEYADAAAGQVRDALLASLALGEGPAAAERRVRAAAGLPRQQGLRLARTEMLRAAREASLAGYRANRQVVQTWIWHAKLDGETCACCWAMHGTEHGLEERLDDHPNGRCAVVPRTVSWGALLGDDTLPDTRPEIPRGVQRFAALDADAQAAILGPTLHELYAAGVVGLEDCVTQTTDARWGSLRRAATVAEALQHAETRRGAR